MRVRLLLLVTGIGCAAIAVPALLRAVISGQSMEVYREAVKATTRKSYGDALAKLEALILHQPVTVSIDAATVPKDAPELGEVLPDALRIWQDAMPDAPFVEVADGKRAQVIVRFVRSMPDVPLAQGDINAQRDFYWSRSNHGYKLSATIRIVQRAGRRYLRADEAAGVIAHELGHLLGLDDVNSEAGLMGYFVAGRPKVRVEQEELDALLGFRKLLRDQLDETKRLAQRATLPP